MTGATLLDNALAMLSTSCGQSPEYAQYALPLINVLLAETNAYNNSLRAARGLAEYEQPQSVTALSQELPAEAELCAAALAYGLCAKLLLGEEELTRAAYFNNAYVAAVEDAARFVPTRITDCYGGDAT